MQIEKMYKNLQNKTGMGLKSTVISVMVLFISTLTHAQANEKKEENLKWDVGLEGMLGVSVGDDFYALNVGGPSLLLRLNNDWRIGFGALPSFYVKEGRSGAKLGVSPRIDYKNFVLIAPFFHFDNSDKWVWSVGLGYKFHKKKQ